MTTSPPLNSTMFELPELFSADECASLIAWSETHGYIDEPADADTPPTHARSAVEEPLPVFVWSRLAESLAGPAAERFVEPVFYRFDPGQRLLPAAGSRPSFDSVGEIRWCVVVYLNEGFGAGETMCYPAEGPASVLPRQGMALVFPAYLTSEELPVQQGRKYILRAEILCRSATGAR
jgi:hypothetical protein